MAPPTSSRRSFASGAAAAVAAALARPAASAAPPASGRPMNRFRAAISVSPFSESVIRQVRLTDGAVTAGSLRELQLLYVRHGSTEVYQRIATRRRAIAGTTTSR